MTVDQLPIAPPRNSNRPTQGRAADPLLNSAQAAGYLNVPLSTLRNQRRNWGLHPFKVGRALQFRQSELDAYLARSREGDALQQTG